MTYPIDLPADGSTGWGDAVRAAITGVNDLMEGGGEWDGSAVSATLDAGGSGAITVTPVSGGTAVRVLTGTLTANRAVTFATAADDTTIRLSMLRVTFGAFSITAGGETFTAPTVAEWTRIGGVWERSA